MRGKEDKGSGEKEVGEREGGWRRNLPPRPPPPPFTSVKGCGDGSRGRPEPGVGDMPVKLFGVGSGFAVPGPRSSRMAHQTWRFPLFSACLAEEGSPNVVTS